MVMAKKLIEFMKKYGGIIKIIIPAVLGGIMNYFTEFYKAMTIDILYGIPIFICILLTGYFAGSLMTITLRTKETGNDFFVELPATMQRQCETGYNEFLGFCFKVKGIPNTSIKQVLPAIYCPDCKLKMLERVTFFGNYKFECIKCGKVQKSKISKRELMELFSS